VLKELSDIFDKVPIAVEKVENPSLIIGQDISAVCISLTQSCEMKVLYALSDEIVAEEI
jgi:hypothetical protein